MFYLPGVCTHIEGKTRVRNILKSLEKNTIFNEHPVVGVRMYLLSVCPLSIINKITEAPLYISLILLHDIFFSFVVVYFSTEKFVRMF